MGIKILLNKYLSLYKIIGRVFKINQVTKKVILLYYLIKVKGLLYRILKVVSGLYYMIVTCRRGTSVAKSLKLLALPYSTK